MRVERDWHGGGGGGGVYRGRHRAEADRRGRGGKTALIGEGKLAGTRGGETGRETLSVSEAAGVRHGHAARQEAWERATRIVASGRNSCVCFSCRDVMSVFKLKIQNDSKIGFLNEFQMAFEKKNERKVKPLLSLSRPEGLAFSPAAHSP